jgi:nucleoside-diphosphate-sugar epimerase
VGTRTSAQAIRERFKYNRLRSPLLRQCGYGYLEAGQEMGESAERSSFRDVAELEDILSEPTEGVIRALAASDGDIVILGVGGKMGPTLARMARRACQISGLSRRIIGVSRFSSSKVEQQLRKWGMETIRCDLLDGESLARLPDAADVVYMAGMKFGSTGKEWLTWAMNVFLPGLVCERYRNSRIAVFSTGNVYAFSPISRGGSREEDTPEPRGEYAMSCLGRERICEHFSRKNQIKVSLIRLNYACELRYGVLVDIAQRVYAGQAVPLSMGYVNTIWQGDASAMTLQALGCASSPPFVVNVAGPEVLSVRRVAEEFAEYLHKPVHFTGMEPADALLSNAQKAYQLFGRPRISASQMLTWIADWVARGGETWAKPTHFEERAGRF